MLQLLNYIFDLIFPRKCMACKSILTKDETGFCNLCYQEVNLLKDFSCKICGRNLDTSIVCNVCATASPFTEVKGLFIYDGIVRNSILNMKFNKKIINAHTFGNILGKYLKEADRTDFDMIVYVPMTEKGLKIRGFNQSEEIAEYVSKIINVKIQHNVLKKIKEVPTQKNLSFTERNNNVKGAFAVSNMNLENKRILLIDDVYTSGSTMFECGKILKEAGAAGVFGAVIAVTSRHF